MQWLDERMEVTELFDARFMDDWVIRSVTGHPQDSCCWRNGASRPVSCTIRSTFNEPGPAGVFHHMDLLWNVSAG
jgi:hypothetical protein